MPRETPTLPPMPRDGLRALRIRWSRRAARRVAAVERLARILALRDRPLNDHEGAVHNAEPSEETMKECGAAAE